MEPFLAFFTVDGFFAALLGAAVVGAGPGLLTDDAQRQPLRGQSQGGMDQHAARSRVGADVTQALGLGEVGVVERGGVLDGEDDFLLSGSFLGGMLMGFENFVRRYFFVVQEAVGGFGFAPQTTGLGDGGLG